MRSPARILFSTALLSLGLLLTGAAQASSYLVEVLLFSQPSPSWQHGEAPHWSWADQAVQLEQTTRSDLQRIDPTRYQLQRDADRLSSSGYKVLLHTAWQQPADADLQIALHQGENQGDLYPVQGLVTLTSERPLEIDLQFWLNRADGSEKLHHLRRLRLDETHYLDHQSLGLLVRISR